MTQTVEEAIELLRFYADGPLDIQAIDTLEDALAKAQKAIQLFRKADNHYLIHGCISGLMCHEWFHIQNAACLAAMDFEMLIGGKDEKERVGNT